MCIAPCAAAAAAGWHECKKKANIVIRARPPINKYIKLVPCSWRHCIEQLTGRSETTRYRKSTTKTTAGKRWFDTGITEVLA